MDVGNGIEATMVEHEAKWDKSCHTEINITKIQRAEKRKASMENCDPNYTSPKKYISKSIRHEPATKDICIFCEDMSSS